MHGRAKRRWAPNSQASSGLRCSTPFGTTVHRGPSSAAAGSAVGFGSLRREREAGRASSVAIAAAGALTITDLTIPAESRQIAHFH